MSSVQDKLRLILEKIDVLIEEKPKTKPITNNDLRAELLWERLQELASSSGKSSEKGEWVRLTNYRIYKDGTK